MGGPVGAYEDEQLTWLVPEKRLIADAVTTGVPLWGVCVGAQLMAASLGAAVVPGPARSEAYEQQAFKVGLAHAVLAMAGARGRSREYPAEYAKIALCRAAILATTSYSSRFE